MGFGSAERNYTKLVKFVDHDDEVFGRRLSEKKIAGLTHCAMGLVTEAGEFMDTLKKFAGYNRPLDEENLKEELCDLMWYIKKATIILRISIQDLMLLNTKKLLKRYPNGWSEKDGLARMDKVRINFPVRFARFIRNFFKHKENLNGQG